MSSLLAQHTEIIERFTGALSSIRQLENYDAAQYKDYPGKYYFFAVTTKDRAYSGEICLLDVGFQLANPMASGSDASPVIGVENGSGKLAADCFTLRGSSEDFLSLNGRFYYVYKLNP